VLENAKGFAIFTIVKAGFVFSARAGSGIVIAKLDKDSESPRTLPLTWDTHLFQLQDGLHPVRLALQVSGLVVKLEPK
jgi:hypothetical protein